MNSNNGRKGEHQQTEHCINSSWHVQQRGIPKCVCTGSLALMTRTPTHMQHTQDISTQIHTNTHTHAPSSCGDVCDGHIIQITHTTGMDVVAGVAVAQLAVVVGAPREHLCVWGVIACMSGCSAVQCSASQATKCTYIAHHFASVQLCLQNQHTQVSLSTQTSLKADPYSLLQKLNSPYLSILVQRHVVEGT